MEICDAIRMHADLDREIFYPRDRTSARQRLGIPDGCRLIVSAGELIEAKGHQHVAEAVHDLVQTGANVALLIVGGTSRGGPKFETTLREYVESLGLDWRIRFAGWVGRDAIAELLSAADVFCLASYTEGWPNVIHEAMACGTPVVATRVGAVPEMIPSSDFGLVVSVKDQPALMKGLGMAIESDWDRAKIARKGGRMTWDEVSRQVHALFQNVVGGESIALPQQQVSGEVDGR